MKYKYWNLSLVIVFFLLSILIVWFADDYKSTQSAAFKLKQYNKLATSLNNKFEMLLAEKKNATLTIALALAENTKLKESIFISTTDLQKELASFSSQLRGETDFKNVWVQVINDKGVSLARSWTKRRADSLKKVRFDVAEMNENPKISTSVSVGKYDLSIKARVPVYNATKYVGFLEVITHMNSIDKKIKELGFETVVLVDKSYRKQLKYPFTNLFIDDYYVANKSVDNELLNYLHNNDIEKFINYTTNFSSEKSDKYFIVNYTLFNNVNKPMAYVLMFKEFKQINTSSIDNTNLIVDILTFCLIAGIGFILFLMKEKNIEEIEGGKKLVKYVFIFLSFFILFIVIVYMLIQSYQMSERSSYIDSYNTNIEKNYRILSDKFKIVANTMFETTLNNKRVLELLNQAYTDKDTARDALYELLIDKYQYMKQYEVRQLHFHLKNSESFLRFHRPNKYGDSLKDIRATVEWVNENQIPIIGFEEGRIYNGFRYVYPLKYQMDTSKKIHVGSVEVSFSAHAIAHEFANVYDAKIGFMISKYIVDSKVFVDEHSNYGQSDFEDFYYEKLIKKQLEQSFIHFDVKKISKGELDKISRKIFEGKTFSSISENENIIFTFVPLKNPVTRKVVGAIILQMDNKYLEKQKGFFFLFFLMISIVILLIVLFIFREFMQKIKLLNLSLKTQQILDIQDSIVIVTDGKKLLDANKTFLEFLNFDSLDAFKQEHDCICDYFIKDENYYHLGKLPGDINWAYNLGNIPPQERIVLMESKTGVKHSFTITFAEYQEDYFIITFTDITGTMSEQLVLENKILHDKLTNAYNREFFERQSANLILENKTRGKFLGVILFDIDFFKNINDTYGHNIGDDILVELVTKVNESIRHDDYLIRWGGEEFIVLISIESIEQAYFIAENLRKLIKKHQFKNVEELTCSFGVTLHDNNESISETVNRADEALYLSKTNGRNRVSKL